MDFITPEFLAFAMFGVTVLCLLMGFPVALTLPGVPLLFAFIGYEMGFIKPLTLLGFYPARIVGTLKSDVLVSIPMFIFMGIMLDKSNIAARLLEAMGKAFGKLSGGLGISVVLVGAILAASTGVVGATVVTMGLMSLPLMLKAGYSKPISTGLICASGTLGQIIPPSVILILLTDQLQQANEKSVSGSAVPEPITVIDMFAGALIPGLALVAIYVLYLAAVAFFKPSAMPSLHDENAEKATAWETINAVFPPVFLIIIVLGSIFAGIATPNEAAAVGAIGATFLASTQLVKNRSAKFIAALSGLIVGLVGGYFGLKFFVNIDLFSLPVMSIVYVAAIGAAIGVILLGLFSGAMSFKTVHSVGLETAKVTTMVFIILIGAGLMFVIFSGFGGAAVIEHFLENLPGGQFAAILLVMVVVFILGFFLDFIEIILIIVPICGPILIKMGIDPLWLGVMMAMNLQTSFLTPPFGFALFYLRGVAPASVKTIDIYKGVVPFIMLQIIGLAATWYFPQIVTWLPKFLKQ